MAKKEQDGQIQHMEIIADLHTHTLASTHAFNTVTEMARAAYEMGHKAIAITDHGPQMPDSPHIWHFYNLMRLPQKIEGVFLLREIDFPQELVVNASMETLVQVLHEHKKPVAAVMEV